MNQYLYALTELAREDDRLQVTARASVGEVTEQVFVNYQGIGTARIARRVASNITTKRARLELDKLVASGDVIKSTYAPGGMSLWLPVNFLANAKRAANPPKCAVDGVLLTGPGDGSGICGHSVCGNDAICGAGVDVDCVHMVEELPELVIPVHLIYSIQGACMTGNYKRPQLVMRELGISYQHQVPQSVADCWEFWNCENIPEKLPDYLTPREMDPMSRVGFGLTIEDAEKIRDYNQRAMVEELPELVIPDEPVIDADELIERSKALQARAVKDGCAS